ncbi:MAG: hypothetical protein GXO54_04245, partial [Chloroflexi bacterium]|nr:hypothetical protein [Chloroflexota bacterium]
MLLKGQKPAPTPKPKRPWWSRVRYRVRQTWLYAFARPRPADLAEAQRLLGPQLWKVFQQQSRAEQAHALRVWRRVQDLGGDRVVQQAALLHDVGKRNARLRLWERALVVLGRALWPRQARKWAQGTPRGWRRAFVVATHHPQWGADQVRAAGAP